MTIRLLQQLPLLNQKVLMRVDFNVPLTEKGDIADDTRLRASLSSIRYILEQGGSVILMSHLGRPKKIDPQFSLKVCAETLSCLLSKPVQFASDTVGPVAQQLATALQPGQILLLENLRYSPEEEAPSLSFARELASLGNCYVNDAFGTAHRNHSSTTLIASCFPAKAAAGLLIQKELHFLEPLLHSPKLPFALLLGGSKISSKLGVVHGLLPKISQLFIGGAMSYTLLKAKGISIGNSLWEPEQLPHAQALIASCAERKIPLYLPEDLLIADSLSPSAKTQIIATSEGIPRGWQGVDIGPKTICSWAEILSQAATIFWNGPLGAFEHPAFAKGTRSIAFALSTLSSLRIIGGGDSVAAITQAGLQDRFSHLSTGGGATLEYLEHGCLPGLDALRTCSPRK